MLNIPLSEWVEQIRPRLEQAGLSYIPNCKNAEFAGNFERELHVEFETPQDELMFVLRFMG
jgi:hypothetical protein